MTTFNKKRQEWLQAAVSKQVEFDHIVIEDKKQMRVDGTDQDTVERYAEDIIRGDELPPVTLAKQEGKYVLLDGYHRVEAARLAGKSSVIALVVSGLSEKELDIFRLTSNLQHGKVASNKDRAESCKQLLNESFDDFVDGYRFDMNAFADYYGFGLSTVKKHSKFRRSVLQNQRDIKVVCLSVQGKTASVIGEELGITRKTVGLIMKSARGAQNNVKQLKAQLNTFKNKCAEVIEIQDRLQDEMELPSHNGENFNIYNYGVGVGYDWNTDEMCSGLTITKGMAKKFGWPDPEKFPSCRDAVEEDEHSPYFKFRKLINSIPEIKVAENSFEEIYCFHFESLAFPSDIGKEGNPLSVPNDCRLGHVYSYLNDIEYKENYDFWRSKAAGKGDSWKANTFNPDSYFQNALKQFWAYADI